MPFSYGISWLPCLIGNLRFKTPVKSLIHKGSLNINSVSLDSFLFVTKPLCSAWAIHAVMGGSQVGPGVSHPNSTGTRPRWGQWVLLLCVFDTLTQWAHVRHVESGNYGFSLRGATGHLESLQYHLIISVPVTGHSSGTESRSTGGPQ